MARQMGIIKLKGTIGDITFYKTKDGHLARQKGGIDKERFLNDPNFQRTRENAAEFGRAGHASKALTSSLRPILNKTKDSKMNSRLVKEMMRVVKADTTSARGERNVVDGDLSILKGFDLNGNARLSRTLYVDYELMMDPAEGTVEMMFQDFIPRNQLAAPAGTTHFRLIAGALLLNFETEAYSLGQAATAELPYNDQLASSLILEATSGFINSGYPFFVLLGVEFLQQVNSNYYSLNNGVYNTLNIVEVKLA